MEKEKNIENPIRWFEIYVSDMNRAKMFYESVFNVKLSDMSQKEIKMFGFPSNPDKWGCSGALVQMPDLKPSGVSTIIYFGSEDCQIEEKKIIKYKGKIHKSKFSIGEYGYIILAIDTEGNMIGVHSMK